MSRASGVSLDELRPYLFLLRDRDATGHLLRVSGGLDSLVMGEGQILAQVRSGNSDLSCRLDSQRCSACGCAEQRWGWGRRGRAGRRRIWWGRAPACLVCAWLPPAASAMGCGRC